MNTASCKAKGRNLQKLVVRSILSWFPQLTDRDVLSRSMGAMGEDIILSEAAIKIFPYHIECKNQERLNIWASWDQASENKSDKTAVLIIKRNRTDPLVVMSLEDFMGLAHANANGT